MRTFSLTGLALSTALLSFTASAAEANVSSSISSLTESARSARSEAREIRQMLQGKKPDLEQVRVKMDLLSQHAASLRQQVAEMEASASSLNTVQKAEFEKAKTMAELIHIFVMNKSDLLSRTDAHRQISFLRAKADGIEKRAQLLERALTRIQS
jgi:chromosome segregation ATPase